MQQIDNFNPISIQSREEKQYQLKQQNLGGSLSTFGNNSSIDRITKESCSSSMEGGIPSPSIDRRNQNTHTATIMQNNVQIMDTNRSNSVIPSAQHSFSPVHSVDVIHGPGLPRRQSLFKYMTEQEKGDGGVCVSESIMNEPKSMKRLTLQQIHLRQQPAINESNENGFNGLSTKGPAKQSAQGSDTSNSDNLNMEVSNSRPISPNSNSLQSVTSPPPVIHKKRKSLLQKFLHLTSALESFSSSEEEHDDNSPENEQVSSSQSSVGDISYGTNEQHVATFNGDEIALNQSINRDNFNREMNSSNKIWSFGYLKRKSDSGRHMEYTVSSSGNTAGATSPTKRTNIKKIPSMPKLFNFFHSSSSNSYYSNINPSNGGNNYSNGGGVGLLLGGSHKFAGHSTNPSSSPEHSQGTVMSDSDFSGSEEHLNFADLAISSSRGDDSVPSYIFKKKRSINGLGYSNQFSVHGHSPLHPNHKSLNNAEATAMEHSNSSASFVGSVGGSPIKSTSRNMSQHFNTHSTHNGEKWIRDEVLGKGTTAVVSLAHGPDEYDDKLYAIKEYRHRKKGETQKEYEKKVVAEFCIGSTLHHPNIIETVDLIQHEDKWCQVMEYMAGGDLYAKISQGELQDSIEIDCYFRQLLNAVSYIHNLGVVHRDLKPENILLDETHRIIKISDFGVADVFKMCWMKHARKSKGIVGSEPYIAPEEWVNEEEYDPTKVDVWACGIIYYTMIYSTVPWRVAKEVDPLYLNFLHKRHAEGFGYASFDRLPEGPRKVLYKMLDPNPATRATIDEILKEKFIQSIECCLKIDHGKGHLVNNVEHSHEN